MVDVLSGFNTTIRFGNCEFPCMWDGSHGVTLINSDWDLIDAVVGDTIEVVGDCTVRLRDSHRSPRGTTRLIVDRVAVSTSRETLASEMTLRDYFAAQALAGGLLNMNLDASSKAECAYEIADAMLAARSKQNG